MNAAVPDTLPEGLEAWVERIRDHDMPIFGATASAIAVITDSDRSPASELGRVILQDAGMTARVLRLANSAFFQTDGPRISTISRAIVLLGFDMVRSVALSVALIDAMLSGGAREHVASEMARCFHAATHARHAAVARGDASPEEVFIATLLSHLGELAFWCFSGETGARLDAAFKSGAMDTEQAELHVLGFRLRQITQLLARDWELSPLIAHTAAGDVRADSREALVQMGYRLASAAEQGWESEEAMACVREYARLVRVSPEDLAPVLAENAREAANMAGFYGFSDAAKRIPVPKVELLQPSVAAEAQPDPPPGEPDPLVQLAVARELAGLLAERASIAAVLDLALEGVFRSLGADRALLALVSPNRAQLQARSALGAGAQKLQRQFSFLLTGVARDALIDAVERQRPLRLGAGMSPGVGNGSVGRLRAAVGDAHQLLVPIYANGQTVGAFYADRAGVRPGFEAQQLEDMQHFARLAGVAFELAALRNQRRAA